MSQQITPELREWIVAQARAGYAPQAVLDSMIASGWAEQIALDAMENTLSGFLDSKAARETLPPVPDRVPGLPLHDAPLYLDAGDRRVHLLVSLQEPRVVVFGNLLSHDECDALIAAATPRLARSLTVATRTGGEEVNVDRTSRGMFFERGESELIRAIEARIAKLVDWPVGNGEGLQVLQYGPGAQYKPHYDYFNPADAGTPTLLARGGQRVATLIMYLNEPEKGGATVFPDARLEVAPKCGNAVFFSYRRPHPDTKSLHGGAPVTAGEKWIATKWLREREFT